VSHRQQTTFHCLLCRHEVVATVDLGGERCGSCKKGRLIARSDRDVPPKPDKGRHFS
jgi:transcription elongation factor Elf1